MLYLLRSRDGGTRHDRRHPGGPRGCGPLPETRRVETERNRPLDQPGHRRPLSRRLDLDIPDARHPRRHHSPGWPIRRTGAHSSRTCSYWEGSVRVESESGGADRAGIRWSSPGTATTAGRLSEFQGVATGKPRVCLRAAGRIVVGTPGATTTTVASYHRRVGGRCNQSRITASGRAIWERDLP